MSFVYAGLIIIPIVMLALSVVVAIRKNKNGASGKKAFKSHLAVLGVMVLMMACLSFGAYAANSDDKQAAQPQTSQTEVQTEETQEKDGFAQGMGYLAAALSIGLAGIGAGLSIAGGAPAAIGATSEDPKMFGKAMIFCVLGEAIAIYGLVISFMILLV